MLIASLVAVPAVGALAQNTQSNTSAPADRNSNTPGATGHTIVKGDNSSISDARRGAAQQKSGDVGSK
jgi:hypothetical protein